MTCYTDLNFLQKSFKDCLIFDKFSVYDHKALVTISNTQVPIKFLICNYYAEMWLGKPLDILFFSGYPCLVPYSGKF